MNSAAHTFQTVGIATAIFVFLWFFPRINLEAQVRKLPAYVYENSDKKKTTYITSAKKIYIDGYRKVGLYKL